MSIKKNFMYNAVYQILIIILPIITTPYLSRVIGAEGIGIQSYTFSIVNYFMLFSLLGINNHGNRSIAMVREDKEKVSKTFISIYIIQVIMSITMIILYVIYIFLIVNEYKNIFIIQLIYLISSLLDINWFFFGMEKFKLTVIRNAIVKIICTLSIFIFVRNKEDIILYSLILALSSLLSQVILWKYIKGYINLIKVSLNDIKQHIKPILFLFIPVISVSIYKIMDKVMLGNLSTINQVGFFENAEKIISIPLGIIVALGNVMLPKMSNLYYNGNEDESKRYIEISLKFAMFISIGAMAGLIGVGDVFIPLFLGDEFRGAVAVVSVLSITIVFIAWANVIRTQYLIPKKKDNVYIVSTILGAIVNVIINMLLIQKYGAIGAAIGTIFAEGTVAIYQSIMIRKEIDLKIYLKKNVFFLIPGIFMCIIIKYIGIILEPTFLTALLQLIIGVLIYGGISLIYLYLIKDELVSKITLSRLYKKSNNKI